ncbi:hypothetical protein NP233_g4751 [Leucocoprinus birnbaumii]|uniref:Protein F37C4.5 n=1 Tax=Leucocoprinus birnbaumii TaxID=56174 RepID=A0AAD5VU56_9AGAR|nr:hypothetical protein NP233_g4751 [Leucocoprinus birnbaumii]
MSSSNIITLVAADHPVRSVVVLKSSKAEVVRAFKIALKAGQNKITISKLPSTIDTQSVRISGLNSTGIKNKTFLSDVVCSAADASDDASSIAIHALKAQKSTLIHEKKVLDTQAEVLVKYANSLTGEHAGPDVMNKFLATFVEQGKNNIHAIAELDAKIETIDKEIKAEKKKVTAVKGSANIELTAVVVADNDINVELKLTYIVNDTNWNPTYELHAITGDDGQPSRTVSLHYRARITQSTGEDWTDAALTLSTVTNDAMVKQIPKITPVRINVAYASRPHQGHGLFQQQAQLQTQVMRGGLFGQPQQVLQQMQQAPAAFSVPAPPPPPPAPSAPRLLGAAPTGTTAVFGTAAPQERRASNTLLEEDDENEEFEEFEDEFEAPEKLVTQTPMALTYSVRGKSSIPSDGKEHLVTIAVLPFETSVEYISVPRVDPRVYLQCQVKNNSEYRLLPGPVSIILDDSYVSKTTISDVNRNDVFNFTLGDDPSVIISYSRLSKSIKEGKGAFADTANVTTYTTSITVQNKHAFSIEKLVLRDALPISSDSRVRVVLREPKELVEAEEGVYVKVVKKRAVKNGENAIEGEVEDINDEDEEDGEGLKVRWTKEKEGLYEYRWRVDPDDKIKLQTVFETKASSDLTCSFVENGILQAFGQRK